MSTDEFVMASQVRRRYGGISDMTLWRWVRDERMGFPQPRYINRRRYFAVDELDAFDARHHQPTRYEAA